MWRIFLTLFTMIFILSACQDEDPVEASYEKMNYDYSNPSMLDENDIILPHTTIILHGEVITISESVSDLFATRISSEENQEYESVTFKETNVLGIESEDGDEYIVITDDLGTWDEGDLITVTGTFEGINDRTLFPLIKADNMEEFSGD